MQKFKQICSKTNTQNELRLDNKSLERLINRFLNIKYTLFYIFSNIYFIFAISFIYILF